MNTLGQTGHFWALASWIIHLLKLKLQSSDNVLFSFIFHHPRGIIWNLHWYYILQLFVVYLRYFCCPNSSNSMRRRLSVTVEAPGGTQSGSWKLHAFNVFMFVFSVHFHTPLHPHPPNSSSSSSSPPRSITVTVVLVIRDFFGNHTKPAFLQFW